MKQNYHTIDMQRKVNEQELAGYLVRSGQILRSMVDLGEERRLPCAELIGMTGRAADKAVLQLSVNRVAGGSCAAGKRRQGEAVFHGRQAAQAN